ncbi:anti-sigma factor [Hymenobacter rubripertinctus]|uniref:anti-sigma factor n=1 Tax=Hymenobacter rubripertinctus TaxID=2029981 RepID=UPI001601C5C3|nr:anti-sigma factor [Hymenobacter rubripertinctus]
MDTQEYIESGILEEYALGVLSEVERANVERIAREHLVINQELKDIIAGLDGYAQAHALPPPPALRERVLEAWQQAAREMAPPQKAAATAAEALPRMVASSAPMPEAAAPREAVVRQMPAAANAGRRWMIAASVALLLLSALGNYLLYSRLKETEANLQVAQTEQSRYAATQKAALNERDQQLAVLRNEAFQPVDLKGTPKAPDALARVYYNARTKAVYVDVRNLPALPEGKQYQLWALDNGQPVDAGMLANATAAGDSIQQMKNIASAQAFALTVEDIGGVVSPTMSTLTVVGNI